MRSFKRPKAAPDEPSPPGPELSVRDQTVPCAFFGVYLGVDTRR
jgi:hypothetical protein